MSAISIEERVKYYMGQWYDTKITLPKDGFIRECNFDLICLIKKDELKGLSGLKSYPSDISQYLKLDKAYLVAFGDLKISSSIIERDTGYKLDDLPVIVKAAYCGDKRSGIIAKLNIRRHWTFNKAYTKTSWQNKQDKCIWRGVVTGIPRLVLSSPLAQTDVLAQKSEELYNKSYNMHRLRLVRRYYKKYDIGFCPHPARGKGTGVTGAPSGDTPCWNKLLKPRVNIENQLKNKYIISLEGNDVASGLKWQLLSNSVVIMPKPTVLSWAMEDTLVPYEHYVPLADSLDNLEEVLQWCRENDSTCKEIAENATQYMQQFMDCGNEKKISKEIINRYDSNVSWE